MLGKCFTADVAKVVFVCIIMITDITTFRAYAIVPSVSVIYCYGYRGSIARLVGDNDCLCTICRIQCKLIFLIECNLSPVYSYFINSVIIRHSHSLCRAVGLAVFDARNDRLRCVAPICRISSVTCASLWNGNGLIITAQTGSAPTGKDVAGLFRFFQRNRITFHSIGCRVICRRAAV